jgi:hypothetical protein
MLSDNTYKKFIEVFDVDDWQIETDNGWSDIDQIGKTIEYDEWELKTIDGFELICADKHILFDENFNEIYVENLIKGSKIINTNGISEILYVNKTKNISNMFDISIKDDKHRYYTSGILSHNSMWLHNIASNTIKAGKNALVLTLEMAEYKCTKRMGSMLLGIPPSLYEEKSNDTQYMLNKLKSFKNTAITSNLFNSKAGELFVKKFNTSDCTVTDIDNYIMKLQDNKQFKVDMVLVDYLNIMSLEKGLDIKGNLYQKGKHIAEGLRYLAGKHNTTFITATQTDRAVWGASDIKMDAVPESKAIVETADTVWAIIRTTEMKRQNLYRLKNLKLRDGECKEQQVKFTFKPETLTMENDLLVVE